MDWFLPSIKTKLENKWGLSEIKSENSRLRKEMNDLQQYKNEAATTIDGLTFEGSKLVLSLLEIIF